MSSDTTTVAALAIELGTDTETLVSFTQLDADVELCDECADDIRHAWANTNDDGVYVEPEWVRVHRCHPGPDVDRGRTH